MCYIFRIYYVFALFLALFGVDVWIFERFRLNYIFIFDIPPNKIVAGYRTIYRRAFSFIIVICFCAIMSITSSMGKEEADIDNNFPLIPLPFSLQLEKLSKLIPSLWWLSFPAFLFGGVVIFTLIFQKSRKFVEFQVLFSFFKQTAPWYFYCTFTVFFIGDQLSSFTPLLVDVAKCFNINIDWLNFLLVNVPMLIRIGQCIKRYRETN